MPALVAKSYVNLEQVCEPYKVNGKEYVKVRLNNGNIKQVRSYSEAEYRKYNPEVKVIQKAKSQREVFGFGEQGFIWIFKGDTYAALDWFRWAPTRYAEFLGWYLPSDIEMPTPLPANIEPIKLMWEKVKDPNDEDKLMDHDMIKNYIGTLIYDPGVSTWVGEVNDRITVALTCKRIMHFMNVYGDTTFYTFEDKNGNVFTWSTQTSKDIKEDHNYVITGRIKEHTTYRNVKQNVLTRCSVKEKIESLN